MIQKMRHLLSEGFSLEAIAKNCETTAKSVILCLLSDGLNPYQIAKQSGISTSSLILQIHTAIGAGSILRSDVYVSLKKKWLNPITERVAGLNTLPSKKSMPLFLKSLQMLLPAYDDNGVCDLDYDDVEFYFSFAGRSFLAVEIYEMLFEIEVNLHTKIRAILQKQYGHSEAGWWTQGVPETVRRSCADELEKNAKFVTEPKYNFTTLLNLKEIIEKRWAIFSHLLPSYAQKEKEKFSDEFDRLNGIRNKVMHPVRGAPPTEEEFIFVKQMQTKLDLSKWSKK
jgi:hypothetical protein